MFKRLLCLSLLLTTPALAADDQTPVSLPHVQRKAVLERPLVFPRIRNIYNLYRNFFQNFARFRM